MKRDFSLTFMFFKNRIKANRQYISKSFKNQISVQKVGMSISKTIKSSELLNIL